MTEQRLAWQGGKCRVPQFWGWGAPAGHCGEAAFGEQLPEAILVRERGFAPYRAQYGNRIPFCCGPCCPNHGGPKEGEPLFFQDGWTNDGRPMWCAVYPDFENLQESPAGFSGNPFEAREKLIAAAKAGAVQ